MPEAPEEAAPEVDDQRVEPEVEAIVDKADNPDAVRNLIDSERARAKAAADRATALEAQVREFEDKDKTETERLSSENDRLKQELAPAQMENLKLRVALEKGLPMDLIDRLRGEDAEALAADADELLKLVKPDPDARTSFDAGVRTTGAAPKTMDDLMRANVRR